MQRQHVSNCPFLKYPPAEEYDMELNAGVGFLIGMDDKLYIVVVDILSCSLKILAPFQPSLAVVAFN